MVIKYNLHTTLLILGSFLILSMLSGHPKRYSTNLIQQPRSYFGVALSTSAMNNDMTFAIITKTPDGRKNMRHISKNDFLHIASGKWKHPVNPKGKNLFEENNVFGGIFLDTISGEETLFCSALDSLWKIKHSTNPYYFKSIGWAHGKYMPSSEQLVYLHEEYGIYNLNVDYFADTSFWKILRDVTRPEWIAHYRSL